MWRKICGFNRRFLNNPQFLGTTFRQRPTPPTAAARRDDNSSNDDVTKMGHVLIVDDDPALRPMMTEYFVNPDHSASLGDSSLSPWIRFSIHTGMDQVL
jgi:hypothetical protein